MTTIIHLLLKPGVAYMPVPRCDGCRYWRVHRDFNGNTLKTGRCATEEIQGRWMWLDRDQDSIITKADFGCVQWIAK